MKKINVVAINGSARRDGNTAILLRRVLAELEKEGIGTSLVQLSGMKIRGCMACYKCFELKNRRCVVDDAANQCLEKIETADAVLLGSPTYFADVTTEMKAMIDRVGLVSRANDNFLRRKVGAGVVAVRRGGAVHVFDTLNHFFTISEMIVVGSCYWNMGIGREIGEVEKDEEGIRTMEILGQNMAWLLKKIHA